jgi:transcriptional regulator NrdR family protein
MTENKSQISLSELIVEKRSGNSEKFDEEKLVRGISRSGTPFLLTKDISKSIINKLVKNPPTDNLIYSNKIREYVIEELKQRNQDTIAESYSGYSKNKVTTIKEEQLKNTKYASKGSPSITTTSKQFAKDKDNVFGRGSKNLPS